MQSSEQQPPDKVFKYRLRFITIHEGQGGVYLRKEKEEEGKDEKETGKRGQKRGRKKATKNELEATEDVARKQGNNELENTDVAAQYGAHYYGYLFNFASSQWYKLDDHDVDDVEENEVLADARDKVCMLHYVCLGSKEYELCHQIDTSLFPTPERNPPLLADATRQEIKLIDNSKSEPYIPVADPPHGASKASLPNEVASCPPAAPHTAAPSDSSLAPKQGDQSPKQSDIGTSTAAPITATHLAAGERKSTREMYLTAVQDMYPEHNMGYLRSHMVLDEDWANVRANAASNAFRAVKDIIEAKEPECESRNDDDKHYDSDGNTVSSVASYMQKKPKKTKLDDEDRKFFNSLPTCYALYFAFDTHNVSKSFCPFAKYNKSWRERHSLESILDGMECNDKEFTADGLRDHISQCNPESWCGMGVKLFLHELYPKTASKEVTSKQNKKRKKNSKSTHSQLSPPIE